MLKNIQIIAFSIPQNLYIRKLVYIKVALSSIVLYSRKRTACDLISLIFCWELLKAKLNATLNWRELMEIAPNLNTVSIKATCTLFNFSKNHIGGWKILKWASWLTYTDFWKACPFYLKFLQSTLCQKGHLTSKT